MDLLRLKEAFVRGTPYLCILLILIVDDFPRMIHNKVHENLIHVAKASRSGPEISHLLFADDNLQFTTATRQEFAEIVNILKKI